MDLDLAPLWNTSAEVADFDRATAAVIGKGGRPGALLRVDDVAVFVWDVGEGAAQVWRDAALQQVSAVFELVSSDARAAEAVEGVWRNPYSPGSIALASGWLLILYSLERGGRIDRSTVEHGQSLKLSIDQAGLIVRVEPGEYRVDTNEVHVTDAGVFACRLTRIGQPRPRKRPTRSVVESVPKQGESDTDVEQALESTSTEGLQLGLFLGDAELRRSVAHPSPTPAADTAVREPASPDVLPRSPAAIGYVNSEGGPLLLVDLQVARAWSGAEGGDYDRVIAAFEPDQDALGVQLPVGDSAGFLWNIPAGTISVQFDADANQILLAFGSGDDDEIARQPSAKGATWTLSLPSGWLLILWSPETASDLDITSPKHGQALDLSMGRTALIVRVSPGDYLVEADESLEGEAGTRWCRLRPL